MAVGGLCVEVVNRSGLDRWICSEASLWRVAGWRPVEGKLVTVLLVMLGCIVVRRVSCCMCGSCMSGICVVG